jgi:hypothetical protein
MQQRIVKVLSISIISAACFALPATGLAQSRASDPTTGAAPSDPSAGRSPAADKNQSGTKKDPSADRKQETPPPVGSEQAPPARK